ncbi:hypothetical protein VOLCADRAFT_90161 [Volvox carteri f. nagariensis]|uniref:TIR domain-containing protein n=1 Tax=Volvox carteri f. nagariensis TaxID=3068 RepID=D8TTM6_VOLCA|nr:uncharacterized protein VOLCADRAFT_90161 [Volvox carteri f. nagariensis]EFJ49335.1 hypothetical protein VOLCADRAFT_90161 [Volvox carteri f. nagariensis]|eukprot:XP_002949783.1 hypothetical protein VOLCADRAFT_90161 [Volvox carteri f. nagariensis]
MLKWDVMLSYRTADTGAKEFGGDGTVLQIKTYLEEHGYTVYLNENVLEGGHDWSKEIQQAVMNCMVFVMLCSQGQSLRLAMPVHSCLEANAVLGRYGENKWTFGEFQFAESERKHIIPLWHSGTYPPPPLKVMLGNYTRVPKGGKPLVQCDFDTCMKQLESRLGQALAKTAQEAAAARDATKPSTTPTSCIRKLIGHEDEVLVLCWSSDSRTLVSGGADKQTLLWEASSGRCMNMLRGHRHEICALGYSPDGRRLTTVGEEGTVRVWHAEDPQYEPPLILPGDGSLTSMSWYPDNYHLLTCSRERVLRVWNVWLGARERLLRLPDNVGFHLRLSPDGYKLAASGSPPIVWVLKETTGEPLLSMQGHADTVTSLAWSPDGRFLATTSRDKTARVWDVATGQCRIIFAGHTEFVTAACWSPDGRQLATGSDDKTLRVWDLGSGVCRRTLSGHAGAVTSVAWSPDGRHVATGCTDKSVRIWA